jgi:hypothetical protein
MDKSRIAKERRSLTPAAFDGNQHDRMEPRARDSVEKPPPPSRGQQRGGYDGNMRRNEGPPRERSLSPYSKRLALTQAMNTRR